MDPNTILIRLQPYQSAGEISEVTLTSIVSQFGSVARITILNRLPDLYFRVEFERVQSSQDALEFLDGFVDNVGWIKTFPAESVSQFPSVKSSLNRQPEYQNLSPSRSGDLTCEKRISVPYQIINYSNRHHNNSKVNAIRVSCNRSHEDKNRSLSMSDSDSEHRCGKNISTLKTEIEVTHDGNEDCKKAVTSSTETLTSPNLDLPAVSERSCFVQIHNLNPKFLNHKVMINLACCFGNALRVYINSTAGVAIIRYRNPKDADRVIIYLQDQLFFGSRLKLTNATPEGINPISFAPTDSRLKAFDCKPPDFRYKNSLKVKFNAPSPVLHLTNLSENCTPQILFQILQSIHEPSRIFKLAKKSKNTTSMMLVEFRTVEESREVLTILHNKIIDHKSIRISFSHAKLD